MNAIQLLICNPSEARTPYQAGRICDGVINLARTFTKQVLVQLQLEIRCYATPASLRGRRFGAEFVSIGWYTYDRRFGDLVDQDQIVGDLNPVVVARHGRPGTLALERMFDEVFNYLWVNSVGVEDACRGLAARPHNFPSKDWLRAVSTAR